MDGTASALRRGDQDNSDQGGQQSLRRICLEAGTCVRPETSAAKVVEKMLAMKVRRLFVVDDEGALVGVISAIDVLGKLRSYGPDDG